MSDSGKHCAARTRDRGIVAGVRRIILLALLFLAIALPATAEQTWDLVADASSDACAQRWTSSTRVGLTAGRLTS